MTRPAQFVNFFRNDTKKDVSVHNKQPLGTAIHNIEITLGKGGQLARAAGAVAKLIAIGSTQGKALAIRWICAKIIDAKKSKRPCMRNGS